MQAECQWFKIVCCFRLRNKCLAGKAFQFRSLHAHGSLGNLLGDFSPHHRKTAVAFSMAASAWMNRPKYI
jgi:hypothetical protein